MANPKRIYDGDLEGDLGNPEAHPANTVQGQMARNGCSNEWRDVYEKDGRDLILALMANLTGDKFSADRCAELAAEAIRRLEMVDPLINHCDKDDGECMTCSNIVCPFGEPLHFHHDGCPACWLSRQASSVPNATDSSNATGVSS